jgi:hypothetical protein
LPTSNSKSVGWLLTALCLGALALLCAPSLVRAGGPSGIDLLVSGDPEEQEQPAAAYNPARNEYLVVWTNDRSEDDDLFAQLVSGDGTLVGLPFPVSTGSGADRRLPALAFNGTRGEYLVVWEHQDTTGIKIKGQRLSESGQPVDGELLVGPPSSLASGFAPAVAYAARAETYLVVWQNYVHGSPASSIEGQVLSDLGAPVGPSQTMAEGTRWLGYERPDVAAGGKGYDYLVVWQREDKVRGAYDVFARRVGGDGSPQQPGEILICIWPGDQFAPTVEGIAASPYQEQYLVAWEHRSDDGLGDIHAIRLSGSGCPLGPYLAVADSPADETNPDLAAQAQDLEYLVAWTHAEPGAQERLTRGRAVSAAGTLPGDTGDLTAESKLDGAGAALAAGRSGQYLAVCDGRRPGEASRDIFGHFWGDSAGPQSVE